MRWDVLLHCGSADDEQVGLLARAGVLFARTGSVRVTVDLKAKKLFAAQAELRAILGYEPIVTEEKRIFWTVLLWNPVDGVARLRNAGKFAGSKPGRPNVVFAALRAEARPAAQAELEDVLGYRPVCSVHVKSALEQADAARDRLWEEIKR